MIFIIGSDSIDERYDSYLTGGRYGFFVPQLVYLKFFKTSRSLLESSEVILSRSSASGTFVSTALLDNRSIDPAIICEGLSPNVFPDCRCIHGPELPRGPYSHHREEGGPLPHRRYLSKNSPPTERSFGTVVLMFVGSTFHHIVLHPPVFGSFLMEND